MQSLDNDPYAYALEVRKGVQRFVGEGPEAMIARVRAVEPEGEGRAIHVVVTFTTSDALVSERWAIWDEANPFEQTWCPAYEVSSEIGIELAEMLRKPSL
jgi:hypothetical protein